MGDTRQVRGTSDPAAALRVQWRDEGGVQPCPEAAASALKGTVWSHHPCGVVRVPQESKQEGLPCVPKPEERNRQLGFPACTQAPLSFLPIRRPPNPLSVCPSRISSDV